MVRAKRLGIIVHRFCDQRVGANLNGPSLIKVPDWIKNRLGRYYLYFAHHLGSYIRMAYADRLEGPWQIYSPGVLDLSEVPWLYEHIASPDVHIDHERQELRLYYHGVSSPEPWQSPTQSTYIARSKDGLSFAANSDEIVAESYFREFFFEGQVYGISLGGTLWRLDQKIAKFAQGPRLTGLPSGTRHPAILNHAGKLWVAWTTIGDCPERIWIDEIDSSHHWRDWSVSHRQELLRPEFEWEGAHLELEPSRSDIAPAPVNQLRDPAFFVDGDKVYLAYSVAGEAGIALAELEFD